METLNFGKNKIPIFCNCGIAAQLFFYFLHLLFHKKNTTNYKIEKKVLNMALRKVLGFTKCLPLVTLHRASIFHDNQKCIYRQINYLLNLIFKYVHFEAVVFSFNLNQ